MSTPSTICLYVFVILSESFFAYLSQRRRIKYLDNSTGIRFRPFWFVIAFLLHWIIIGFTKIGSDYRNYYNEIVYLNWDNFLTTLNRTEPGFTFLVVLLKSIFVNPDLVIFAFKTLTTILEFAALWKMRDRMSLSLGLFAYNALLFPRLFYILAMMLAISLLMNSIVLLLQGKDKLALILLVLGILMHNSLLLVVPIYIYYYIYYKKGHSIKALLIILLIVGIVGVLISYRSIYNLALTRTSFFNQYSNYSIIFERKGSGLLQYIYFIPIVYFIVKCYRYGNDKRLCGFMISFAVFGFAYALLGYRISVFARMQYNFTALYCILVPIILYDERIRENRVLNVYGPLTITSTSILWKIYIIIRGIDVFVSAFGPNSVSEVSNYIMYWPF